MVWGIIPNPGIVCDCTQCATLPPNGCPSLSPDREIGHAALVSTGPNKGQVLLWYYEQDAGSRTYFFDPANPGTLTPVASVLPASCINCGYVNEIPFNIFCASHSFDASGQLIACGGLPAYAIVPPPPGTCLTSQNFVVLDAAGNEVKPSYDATTTHSYICHPCSQINTTFVFNPGSSTVPPAWGQGPNLNRSRYYPSSVAVPGASLSVVGGTFVPGFPIVVGGTLDALCGDHHPGTATSPLWPATLSANSRLVDGKYVYGWEYPVQNGPAAFSFVELGTSAGPTGYLGAPPPPSSTLPALSTPPEYYRFFPQAFLLGNYNPAVEEIFVAGDTHFEWFGTGAADPSAATPPASPGFNTYQALNVGTYSTKFVASSVSPDPIRVAPVVDRYYSSAVMLHTSSYKNRIIRIGGSRGYGVGAQYPSPAEPIGAGAQASHASVAEFDHAASIWRPKASISHPRLFQNAVVLPDGKILVIGGCGIDYHNNLAQGNVNVPGGVAPTNVCEIIDIGGGPLQSGSVIQVASVSQPRLYHAVAVLLPDARVLIMGGEDYGIDPLTFQANEQRHSGEIYSPPYLFQGARPVISQYPSAPIGYYSPSTPTFPIRINVPVATGSQQGNPPPSPGNLKVVLIRPGSASHHFDFDQKYYELDVLSATFWRYGGIGGFFDLNVRRPENATFAVNGYYMLFVLRDGVPSVAATVKIG